MADFSIDRILKLGQILALIIVPIWLLGDLQTANRILSARMEELGRTLTVRMDGLAQVQIQSIEAIAKIDAKTDAQERQIGILEGIRQGAAEAERRRIKGRE